MLLHYISHTDKIKETLGKLFNEQVFHEQGGEVGSLHRIQIFKYLIKEKQLSKEQIQLQMMEDKVIGDKWRLMNAEIIIASKECV